jgi:hypothetical protein
MKLLDTFLELIDKFNKMTNIVESVMPEPTLSALNLSDLSEIDKPVLPEPKQTVSESKTIEAYCALLNFTFKIIPLIQILSKNSELHNERYVLVETYSKDIEWLPDVVRHWNSNIEIAIINIEYFIEYVSYNKKSFSAMICYFVKSCDKISSAINDAITRHNEVNKDFIIDHVKLLSNELSIRNIFNASDMDKLSKQDVIYYYKLGYLTLGEAVDILAIDKNLSKKLGISILNRINKELEVEKVADSKSSGLSEKEL